MRANVVTAALLLLLGGCGHSIGDSCSTNVECSPQGDRTCDTAQLDGYCTLQGCDLASCPSEAVCIRFFSANFLFLPIASKLGYYSDEDILSREVIAKGVLAIYEGDVPWLVSKKLEGYLSLALRRKAKGAAK